MQRFLCHGGTTTITVSGTGGTTPYSGDGTFTVGTGTYSYTITDAHGCSATQSITVSEPTTLVATCSVVSNVSCNGASNGSASVSGSGGTSPYSGEGTFTGLSAGTYTYTVTDANGCTATCTATISEPAVLVATCSVVSNVSCTGGSNGSASVSATGGTAPYSGTGTFTGLAAGTYSYTVTDAHGCTANCSVTITEPSESGFRGPFKRHVAGGPSGLRGSCPRVHESEFGNRPVEITRTAPCPFRTRPATVA